MDEERSATDDVVHASVLEARRILALEIEEIDRQFRLTERILRLGILILAGAIAVTGLISRTSGGDPSTLYGFSVGVLFNVSGIARTAFLLAAPSRRSAIASGPEITSLTEYLEDETWTKADLDRSLMKTYGAASRVNRASMWTLATGRRTSLVLLLIGAILYLIAIAYIQDWGISHVG